VQFLGDARGLVNINFSREFSCAAFSCNEPVKSPD